LKKPENIYKDAKINSVMKCYIVFFLIIYIIPLRAITFFEQGKESFLNNNPVEAVFLFEKAKNEEPYNEDVFMYLGLSYIQNDQFPKAIEEFLGGAQLNGTQKGRFYLNVGNAYLSSDNYESANEYYNMIIDSNLPEKGDALLNRANIYLNKKQFPSAVEGYNNYLAEVPDSYQKDKIIRLISLLNKKIDDEVKESERLAAEAERNRLLEEQRKNDEAAEAERIRLAEERRRAEEAARQQALMDEILNSLSNISDETQNISAGSETITHTDEESGIDD